MPQQAVGNAVIPASRIGTAVPLADLRQIQHGDFQAIVLQSRRGRRNQARLAGAVRRHHVRVVAGEQRLVQQFVGGAPHITQLDGMQRRPNAKEFAGLVESVRCVVFGFLSHRSKRPSLMYSSNKLIFKA